MLRLENFLGDWRCLGWTTFLLGRRRLENGSTRVLHNLLERAISGVSFLGKQYQVQSRDQRYPVISGKLDETRGDDV